MPKVSVIIPTYNRAEYVVEAVDSVLNQSFDDLELIVVDDGSTDETGAALEKYGDSIQYIRQDNEGVSAARNAGIKAASGEWLSFLDSDDVWTGEYLASQMAQCEQYRDAVAHLVNAVTIFPEGRRSVHYDEIGFSRELEENRCLSLERPLKTIVDHSHWFLQSAVIRHDVLLEAGLFTPSLTIAEDLDLFSRVAAQGPFTFTSKILVEIYRRPEAIECLSSQHWKNGIYSCRAFGAVLDGLLARNDLTEPERRSISKRQSLNWLALGNLLLKTDKKDEARHYYIKSLLLDPSARAAVKYLLAFLPKEVSLMLMRKGKEILPGEDPGD